MILVGCLEKSWSFMEQDLLKSDLEANPYGLD